MRVRGLKQGAGCWQFAALAAPHAGAWIETSRRIRGRHTSCAAPHAGAWIETFGQQVLPGTERPHPMRVRGLKPPTGCYPTIPHAAPHAGAWIETNISLHVSFRHLAAPHAGAWIETLHQRRADQGQMAAPHAGAWIETRSPAACSKGRGRTPCGCVD